MNPTLPPALRTARTPSRSKELRRAVESAALTPRRVLCSTVLPPVIRSVRAIGSPLARQRVNAAVARTELHRAEVARPSPEEPEGTAPSPERHILDDPVCWLRQRVEGPRNRISSRAASLSIFRRSRVLVPGADGRAVEWAVLHDPHRRPIPDRMRAGGKLN